MRLAALSLASMLVVTATVASPAAVAGDTARDVHLYGGIGALAGSVVMFGFAISDTRAVANARDDEGVEAYRARWPSSEGDTCVRAREGREAPDGQAITRPLAAHVVSVCNELETKQSRQYWLWGGGFALATAGIVLLATRPSRKVGESSSATVAHITPLAGPTFGGLSLRLTF